MEFEEEVARTLESYGFPILYRNLYIMLNKAQLTEFDIVSTEFVVEVKSGNYVELQGINELYIRKMMPRDMIMYVYCPKKTDAQIAEYNTNYDTSKIMYINTLFVILKNHKPGFTCTIETQAMFDRFLNLSLQSLKKFTKVYVNKQAFDRVLITLTYYRESCSKRENITWSQKVKHLIDTNVLEVRETLPEGVPVLVKQIRQSKLNVTGRRSCKIPLQLCIHKFEQCKDIEFTFYCEYASERHRDFLGKLQMLF